jgi:hypothetical protein
MSRTSMWERSAARSAWRREPEYTRHIPR